MVASSSIHLSRTSCRRSDFLLLHHILDRVLQILHRAFNLAFEFVPLALSLEPLVGGQIAYRLLGPAFDLVADLAHLSFPLTSRNAFCVPAVSRTHPQSGPHRGADAILLKPISVDRIDPTVRDLIRGRRARRTSIL